MNILIITHHRRHKIFPRSYSIAHALVQRGHQVTLIAISDQSRWGIKDTDWDGVRVVETPDLLWGKLRSGWDVWNLLSRLYFLNRERTSYDLIHCFETRPATIYPALYFSRKCNIPWLIDWIDWYGHGGLIDINRPFWYRWLFGWLETYYEEAFLTQAAGLSVISTPLKERALSLGVQSESILHLPSGTHPDRFPARPIELCRIELGLPPLEPIIGFSSADSHLDLDIVMQALSIVARKYSTVKLMITGRTDHHVLKLANAYAVADRLILTGYLPVEMLPVYLGCCNLFVLPYPETNYNLGRWPNKVGDYMCLARPIVSNPVGDIKTLFENHHIGLLAKWDHKDFAQQIISLLDQPALANEMGQRGLQTAREKYDWKIIITQLEDFYSKTLAEDSSLLYDPTSQSDDQLKQKKRD